MSIYRAYDIRGIYGSEISGETAEKIGKAYGSKITGKVAVGQDVRLSSPKLSQALIKGILSTGVDVVDVGVVPTPLLYYSIIHLGLDGGVMLTASHNPPEYNGFKLCKKGAMTYYGDEITAIGEDVGKGVFRKGFGKYEKKDVADDYIKYVMERIKLKRKIKVVLDCANGTAGAIAPRLFKELGCEVIELFSEADGNFPNHPADPTVDTNLKELIETVKKTGADIGLAYDGDSDRAGFVDEKGGIIRGDQALAIFSREILAANPGAKIIFEVKCSLALQEDILSHGGKPIMYRTGHSFIKKKIKEENAKIAGEMSGHFFFADDFPGFDDGIYASARMVKILSNSGEKMSEIVDTIPKYHSTPEIRVTVPEEIKFQLVEDVKKDFQNKKEFELITVDGVRAQNKDGWGLIRASNTGPKLILRFEGKTQENLENIKNTFRKTFEKYPHLKDKI
ncbi:MAG: phosphomannomutase/phosphoglucomutase [Candidatus Altiarchaeota archaeon]|nr:phosphomannomutase/phosphoglucomutase [Candidatus Altiarchaeota archaeon]